jgi:hypothetical protein
MIILLFVLCTCYRTDASVYADTVYINPEYNAGNNDGSYKEPYKSWDDISVKSNTVYLIKRSTKLILIRPVNIPGKSNIFLGAYGDGSKPEIRTNSADKIMNVTHSKNVTISNISMSGNGGTTYCLRVLGESSNVRIVNCIFSGAIWGIRLIGFENGNQPANIHIKRSRIFNIGDDGIFAQNVHDMHIDSCDIRKVNQKWFRVGKSESQAPGDGIQMDRCRNISITNSTIDRTDTGNKFCIIANRTTNGQIKNNILKGPLKKGSGGASIYFGYGSDSMKVVNNQIYSSPCGIYSHARNNFVYRNIVEKNCVGAWFIDINEAMILNNTFWNNPIALKGSELRVFNNIFYASSLNDHLMHIQKNCETDYNCYFIRRPDMLFKQYGKLPAYTFRTGNGGKSIFGNPLLNAPGEGDFSLRESSPCIDKGLEKKVNEEVIYNQCGETIDIGAKEWCPNEE